MPANKNALLRYRIIDACLTNTMRKYPDVHFLQQKIADGLYASISASTVNKDLQQMRLVYNAPIAFCKIHKGYYYTESSFSLSQFPLVQEEIEALNYSVALLNQLKGTRMFAQFQNAINKVIEGYRASRLIGDAERQILQIEEPVNSVDGDIWYQLLQAITQQQSIVILYKPFDKVVVNEHTFSPYLLKEYRNRWYVVGFSKIKQQVLVLALDRVVALQYSADAFVTDTTFNSTDFFKYSLGITQMHHQLPQRVVLLFTHKQAPYIISQPLHHSQAVEIKENGVEIAITVYPSVELIMSILSYGEEVQVLQPASIVAIIQQKIEVMRKKYL